MLSKCRLETSAIGSGWSASLGPGSLVDLDAKIPGSGGRTYGDVFDRSHFDAVEPEPKQKQRITNKEEE